MLDQRWQQSRSRGRAIEPNEGKHVGNSQELSGLVRHVGGDVSIINTVQHQLFPMAASRIIGLLEPSQNAGLEAGPHIPGHTRKGAGLPEDDLSREATDEGLQQEGNAH